MPCHATDSNRGALFTKKRIWGTDELTNFHSFLTRNQF